MRWFFLVVISVQREILSVLTVNFRRFVAITRIFQRQKHLKKIDKSEYYRLFAFVLIRCLKYNNV